MLTKPFLATFLVLMAVGCAKNEPTKTPEPIAPRTLEEIEAALEAGAYGSAIPGLETLAIQTPQDARIPYYLGLCWSHEGEPSQAASYYQAALALDADMAEARSNLGLVLLELGKIDEAAESLSTYIEQHPEEGSGYYNLGLAQEAKGSLDAAASSYKKASQLDPKDPLPCRALGDVARKRGQLDKAIEHYRRALSRAPGSPELLLVLSDCLVEAGKTQDATANLLTLERSETVTAEALATAAVLLTKAGQSEPAQTLLKACTARFADYPSGFFLLGTSYARSAQWEAAAAQFERFLALEPSGEKAEVARRHLAACRAKSAAMAR